MGMAPTIQGRMSQKEAAMTQVVVCPRCGSVHFTEHTYQRYKAYAYGSGAGADLSVDSAIPQTIRVCLCGWPYEPNLSGFTSIRTKKGQEQEGFSASLANAHEYLAKNGAAKFNDVVAQMATIDDINSLRQELQALTDQLANLGASLTDEATDYQPDTTPASDQAAS